MKANSKIRIQDVVSDVGLQIDDAELRESLHRSPTGLQSVLQKLLAQQQNATRDIVEDVRSGMADTALMAKHGLSSVGLRRTLEKILELDLIDPEDLDRYSCVHEDTARAYLDRQCRRNYPILTASIRAERDPDKRGIVRDISDKGVGTIGLETEVDATDTFTVVEHEFALFSFEAKCRWAHKPAVNGEFLAGLEITRISENDRQELVDWVSISTMGFEGEDDLDLPDERA